MEMTNNFESQSENHIMLEVDAAAGRNIEWRSAGSIGANTIVRVRGFIEDMKHAV